MSDLQSVEERIRRRQEKREERRKRDGVNCNLCCTDEETGTPGCIEESCKAICHNYCPKCPTDNKMAKVVPPDHGTPETQEMQRGGRKTRRKRRRKRRKSRKNRKKTKRRRKRKRKKSKKVRRK